MKRRMKHLAVFLFAAVSSLAVFAFPVMASQEPTFGEKMAQAGRNTLIGLIVVFVILLVLSFIISLFKYIAPKKKTKTKGKTEFVNRSAPAKVASDDDELVAVIIAAICAAEGTEYIPGQYRLKSIKRVKSTRSWNRARREV